jgi:hypothetical protein
VGPLGGAVLGALPFLVGGADVTLVLLRGGHCGGGLDRVVRGLMCCVVCLLKKRPSIASQGVCWLIDKDAGRVVEVPLRLRYSKRERERLGAFQLARLRAWFKTKWLASFGRRPVTQMTETVRCQG